MNQYFFYSSTKQKVLLFFILLFPCLAFNQDISKYNLPRFPGCEGQGKTKEERRICSEGEMMKFIYGNIKYPKQAREAETEGRVIAQFTVLKNGSVGDVEIIRDIGNGCGEEVKRLIYLMNEKNKRWIPASSTERPRVNRFTIPIVFRLSSRELEEDYFEGMEKEEIEEELRMIENEKMKKEPEEEKIFKTVKDYAHFRSCANKGLSKKEIFICTEKKIMNFIYENIKYPAKARENFIEGEVIVQFTVSRNWHIGDIKILKAIGNGCEKEVIHVIKMMNNEKFWMSKSRGYFEPTTYTVPVQFELKK